MSAFLRGEKVLLRSLELEDLDTFWAWFADLYHMNPEAGLPTSWERASSTM